MSGAGVEWRGDEMNKEELLAKLVELQQQDDLEWSHEAADKALLAYINDPAITEAFEALDKWYA
jgi:hypothetical protein